MNPQIEIAFETKSPINTERINGHNKRIYDVLARGEKVNCFQFNGLVFHSRIADIRRFLKEQGIELKSIMKAFTINNEVVHAKEYWIET